MSDPSAHTPASPTQDTPPPRTTGGGFRWEPPSAAELQAMMPGYTIEKILGRGGMGAVYKGVQSNLDRTVAIKILPPGVEKEDPSFAERFKNEAKLMAKLLHPAVVAVFDFGLNSGGQLYIAMEYVDGTDVAQMISTQKKLPPDHALAITAHVCDALTAAHELGIVHRDIKPANVLINMKGQVKVADFGLAKIEEPGSHGLTKTGYAMGTPDFVAPEALTLGTAIDGRADLYAVGVMLYQMLTGNIPRGAFKPASVLVPGLDRRYDPIIQKAMQHDREERHQSAAELRRELDVILTVPLVQNNAPAGAAAAIPAAQVAQVPAQRSAAQKPVGKPPQPRSADAPVRSSTPGGGAAKKPEAEKSLRAPAKSKTPLLIGIGAAAAVAIGAFVMFSGGKKTPPAAAGTSAPPSKSANVASSKPKPAASTPPTPKPTTTSTPSVSKSPPLLVSPSSDKFPPGKWVKVFTKFEDLPEDLRKSGATFEDGWIRFGEKHRFLKIPNSDAANFAVRARILRGSTKDNNRIVLRGNEGKPQYQIGYSNIPINKVEIQKWIRIGESSTLGNIDVSVPAPGNEYLLEFAAIGSRLIGRFGDSSLKMLSDDSLKRGKAHIFGGEDLRDIEVINLDGLSEAEALKILGVDEKGNDLRKIAVAATSPGPAVSSSPILPISASSPQFPPGQWVKLFTKAEDLPENLRIPGKEVEVDSGWLRMNETRRNIVLPTGATRDYGVRATFQRRGPLYQERGQIQMRQKGSIFYQGAAAKDKVVIERTDVSKTAKLAERKATTPIAGVAYQLEMLTFRDRLVCRLNQTEVATVTDASLPSGELVISTVEDVRDIEVINLDGLSEAEALKILGVDEKGNDTRSAAIAQEKQAMEQAKTVNAASAIPELKVLHEQFAKLTAERVTAPFEADAAKLNAGYIGGIDRKITEEKAAGHLDGIIALEAEKKLLADQQPIPADDAEGTTANLKALRTIYRAAYAKIETTRVANLKQLTDPLTLRLKQLEADLTKKDRVPDAKTVREYREKLGEGSAVTPDRSATPGGVAAKMNKAEKSLRAPVAIPKVTRSKPDPAKSRQAVEYALGKGCEVSIDHDGEIIPVKKIDDLPKSRWGLHRVKFLTPVTDEDLQAVTRAVELKEFLCSDRVGAGTFTSLAPLGNTPGLKILTLSRADGECSAEDAQALLQSAETLEQLNWLKLQRDDALLPVVTACRNLNYLYLLDTELTDDDVDQLRNLPVLRSLSFRGSKLTDAGARHLAKCNPLSRLTISEATESGATQLTPEGLAAITKAHGGTLIALGIGSHGSPHTEGMLRSIAADCSVLETLAIRGVTSPEALAGLSKLKKLKQLDFHRTSGKPIPLSVAHCQAISGIKSLETLGVSDCALTGEHVQALAVLKSLKTLHLNRSPSITDASVPSLLSFQDLENLGLVNAGLTPAGILKLTAMKKLKTLTVTGINLTDAHIAQFKAALPGCTITR